MRFRINEAVALTTVRGKRVKKKDIAAKLFPDSVESTANQNMVNICSGNKKSLSAQQINIICDMCGCSADFLLGRE